MCSRCSFPLFRSRKAHSAGKFPKQAGAGLLIHMELSPVQDWASYHCKPHEPSKQSYPSNYYDIDSPWEKGMMTSIALLRCVALFSLKKISTTMLFILIMPCHTSVWHMCHPYCCNMANFLEGSFLKLLWLVFHIPLFPWWFVWPHQRLVTNAYLLSWEVTFSLFKPAMCWAFVIWNLVCLSNRHKRPSILSTGRAICIFILQLIVCLRFHFDSLFLFLPSKEDSAKKYLSSFLSFLWTACKTFETLFFFLAFPCWFLSFSIWPTLFLFIFFPIK